MMYVDPRQRGYRLLYHEGESMHCPGCGHSNWLVGRSVAECAICATALPRADLVQEALPTPIPAFVPALPADETQPLLA